MSQQPEKSVAQILRDAAAIVEKGWCQGHYCADASGEYTTFPHGDRFCVEGALMLASRGADGELGWDAIDALERSVGTIYLPSWNDADERTQAEVVSKLLEAAELAELEATHV